MILLEYLCERFLYGEPVCEVILRSVLQEAKLNDLKNLLVFKSVCGKLVMTSAASLVTELGQ